MRILLLVCLFATAIAATLVPPFEAEEQHTFRLGNSGHLFNSTKGQSDIQGIVLCGVGMRASRYRDHCSVKGKDAYVCKNDSDGNAVLCDVYDVPFDENYFGFADCDHILDLQIFVRALEQASFCQDMDNIRAHDTLNELGTNEKYLEKIRTAANKAKSVNFLDEFIHGFKSAIIDLAVNEAPMNIKKPPLWCAVFLETYHNKAFVPQGTTIARNLDGLAYEALQEMVNDIRDVERKEQAQEYLDGVAWATKTCVATAHLTASAKWVAVQAPWLEV